MPAGLTAADFAYLLPEIVLTIGALAMLVADVVVPTRHVLLTCARRRGADGDLCAVFAYRNADVEVSAGMLAVDRFRLLQDGFRRRGCAYGADVAPVSRVESTSPGEYHFLILCATLGMMVMAGGTDLVSAFVGLETMAVSFYILAGYIKPNHGRTKRP